VVNAGTTVFDLKPGRVLAGKYEVLSFLGSGWEGEVYRVMETRSEALRALKIFYPERNDKDKAVRFHARKLERLRDCPLLVKYHHSESLRVKGRLATALVSEFVEGEVLEDFIAHQRGARLAAFEALHLLRAIASGVAEIHERREYHGDLHAANLLVRRRGVHFDVKVVDFHDVGGATAERIKDDVWALARLLYDALGGARRYGGQPPEIKAICLGLKRSLITRRYPTAGRLVRHLDTFDWRAPKKN